MKRLLIFILAFVITIASSIYQRLTGPTYPLKTKIPVTNQIVKLPRSAENTEDLKISVPLIEGYKAFISYKRYKTNDKFTTVEMMENGNEVVAFLPTLPKAGKYIYRVYYQSVNNPEQTINITHHDVIIRFKGKVPTVLLIAHILFMFIAMLFSNYAGILALLKKNNAFRWGLVSLILLIIGGFILGPFVQYYAFDAFWTGFPFGYDLTDNKVLINVLAWIIGLVFAHKKQQPQWILLASIITLLVYLIPHSLFGSEYDFSTGIIKQG